VRKDFRQPVKILPRDKFSPDYLAGVILYDLNFDASRYPCCSDHRPPFISSFEKAKRPPGPYYAREGV